MSAAKRGPQTHAVPVVAQLCRARPATGQPNQQRRIDRRPRLGGPAYVPKHTLPSASAADLQATDERRWPVCGTAVQVSSDLQARHL